ncbi:MAG: hypothetical protein IV086_00890 [Hyphomonadaceae bacterium]|nr:MAG: hypothetical protein FD160_768 [Caulobacteraceae bacterium]MBT9444233.1 hypothetical protein [Hyphomonadaceae bacterium]TPW06157.1 MAG: hypothetical protein FD124_1870 [Alphaproteobacteria bacterium]
MPGLQIFPLLLIPTILYAMIAIPAGENVAQAMASVAFNVPLASSGVMVVTWGHLILLVSVVTLFVEILKSTTPSGAQMIDNGLAVAVFIVSFILFLLVRPFGTTEFFIIMTMSLLDFLTGSVIMTRVSQRTVQYDRG